ncbi:MAG: YdbH domain-containing protein [Pseudomonadota bacterium]|nr:YdbH domain-containing protein [Pseudomonadota bacterium]
MAETDLPPWLPNVSVKQLDLALPGDRTVQGHLDVSLTEPDQAWVARSDGLWLTGPLPAELLALSPALEGITGSARMGVSGALGARSTDAMLNAGSRLRIAQWQLPGAVWSAEAIEIEFGRGRIQADYQSLAGWPARLKGNLPVTIEATIAYPNLLKPQAWVFKGALKLADQAVQVEGALQNEAGLAADVVLDWSSGGASTLTLRLEGGAAKVGEALAGTFPAWPTPLTFSGGNLTIDLNASLAGTGPEGAIAVNFGTVSGLTNRTAWSGLNGVVRLSLGDGNVRGDAEAELASINPGIPFAPVAVQAQYHAPADTPLAGELSLVRATSGFLGGGLRVKPQQWSLEERPIQATVWLNDLQLGQLMQVYPTEGLDGSGVLEGQVPITIDSDGISVSGGQITARAPGGTLSLPADRLQALAANNEAMALVVEALQNFNYSVLNSTIDYDQDGQLSLGLRLEGESPQVRRGQPIVVNINLEEDIPALMTSLQLSGRVNESVAERVRQLMERQQDSESQSQ